MEAIFELIAQNGLGVAAAIAVAWWYMKKDSQHTEVINSYVDRLEKLNEISHATTLQREIKYQELLSAILEHLKKES